MMPQYGGCGGSGAPVAAAKKSKSTQNEAEWIAYDAAAKTVTVKIMKKGKGPNSKLLKTKKEATFNVIPEGSVLQGPQELRQAGGRRRHHRVEVRAHHAGGRTAA